MTRRRSATLAAWVAGLLLLAWALRQVSWPALWQALKQLTLPELGLLAALNLIILAALTARWRAFVVTLPTSIPFTTLFQTRLAAFALSYFTPGPQFGGEPLQVIALHQRGVPTSAATATVALDKLVELITNFTVLALGVVAVWMVGLGSAHSRLGASAAAAGLFLLPLAYFVSLHRGRLPFAALFRWLAARRPTGALRRGLGMLAESEALAGELARTQPWVVRRALLWAGAAWALMLLEFWLSARFFGASLSLVETLAALAAARFAFLLPMPGGLGALASSQVLVFSALGHDPNVALALVFYIRARDLLIGGLGAFFGARLVG